MAGLQFSDTSTRQGLIQDCEDLLNFPAAGISGNTALLQQFTRQMNIWYQKVTTMIFASQDSWNWDDSNRTDYAIATAPLVINQQDYSLPASLGALRVERVDVTYDGTNWRRAKPLDTNAINTALDTTSVSNYFSTDAPRYDLRAGSVFLFPIPTANVAQGLKIYYARGPLEFITTDTTKQPGFDVAFHRIISLGAAYDYAVIKNLPTQGPIQQQLQDYEMRLKQYFGLKDEDTMWGLKTNYDDSYGK